MKVATLDYKKETGSWGQNASLDKRKPYIYNRANCLI